MIRITLKLEDYTYKIMEMAKEVFGYKSINRLINDLVSIGLCYRIEEYTSYHEAITYKRKDHKYEKIRYKN